MFDIDISKLELEPIAPDIKKQYLSYGGGVNSTALLILLTEMGIDFEAIFSDHGAEYPETYEFMELLTKRGYKITLINARYNGMGLYEYSVHYKIFPCRRFRWCTQRFKTDPINKYIEKPCVMYIGFDAGETNRTFNRSRVSGTENEFPLIDWEIDRDGCKRIIEAAGLPIPRKSGCYFCPFQSKVEFRTLRDKYPELYCNAKTMEVTCNERRASIDKEPTYLRDHPIDDVVQEGQEDLFGHRKPCQCGL